MSNNSDFNWLPNSILKGVKLPKIIYEEDTGQDYGGYYTFDSDHIVIVETDHISSTIAHEFRHYLQWDTKIRYIMHGTSFNQGNNYELAIKNYFRDNIIEMDALLFEHKYAKNWLNDWWLRKLVLEN